MDAEPEVWGNEIELYHQQCEITQRLRAGLDAAIRAADLALFVIRKQNVMPNSSWEAGFKKDLDAAKAARDATEQKVPQAFIDAKKERDDGWPDEHS